tara:strand:+ start:744 stop:1508 length:765 start_codon:yes stop_codon:yes gene_type:complete
LNIFNKILLLFLFNNIVLSQTINIELANKHYNNRSIGGQKNIANPEQIDLAIENFEKSKLDFPADAALGLLQSYYFKGKYCQLSNEKKLQLFEKAKNIGLEKIKQFPDRFDIRYWYLVNLGSWAEISGIVAAAREGMADQMKAQAEQIIEGDPFYADGGGYLMLGVVHYKTPYIPFFLSWPSNSEAIKWLKLSIETGDATLTQKVYYAQSINKEGRKKESKKILREIVDNDNIKERTVEDWEQILKARNLLSEM